MRHLSPKLAAVAGVAFLLSACGGGGGEAAPSSSSSAADPSASESGAPARGDADLVIWTDDLKAPAIRGIAEQFGEENDITVDVQVVSADLQANFVTANTASNGPDIVVGAHDWIGNLVQNGAIDPLQITTEDLSGYGDVAVQATTYDGQLYGLPYGIEALALYRNTDLAPTAPASLDEAFATGLQLKQAGTVESAFNLPVGELGDAYHMQPLYTSMGGVMFERDAEGSYDPATLGVGAPGSIAAAQKIFELGEGGQGALTRSVSGDNSIALFADGKAPYLLSGPWALADVKASGIAYEIQPVPGFAGQQPAQPFAGVQAFFVASNGQNKAFAQEFIQNGMNNEEAMTAMFEGAGLPPAMTSVREAVSADNPEVGIFATAAEGGDPMPAIPAMQSVFEPLGKAYAAIVGGADPTQTMTDTGNTIRQAIGG